MSRFRITTLIVLAISVLFVNLSRAEDASYAGHPAVAGFVNKMQAEHGFDADQLTQLFAKVRHRSRIIELMTSPAEAKPWKDYRPILVSPQRVKQGVAFMQTHRKTLQRAEQVYGVPPEMIVAIIGVETRYGRITGSYRVVDALATLAFDYPKRSAFFSKELAEFLVLAREEKVDPLVLKGSYAGAMGYGQFMPSSYRHYAVDFDGDGQRDIWTNPVDAIGSVANYFSEHGWVKDGAVTLAAKVTGDAYLPMLVQRRSDLKPKYKLGDLVQAGFSPDQKDLPELNQKATAMRLDASTGDEYWVGLYNFYVITRYNHSALYAMAVYQLSQQIAHAAQVSG